MYARRETMTTTVWVVFVAVFSGLLISNGHCVIYKTAYTSGSIFRYPESGSYSNNENVEWRISPASGYRYVRVQLIRVSLESSSGCRYDSLKVYSGSTLSATRCGSTSSLLTTTQNCYAGTYIKLQFRSDSSVTSSGFSVHISATNSHTCVPFSVSASTTPSPMSTNLVASSITQELRHPMSGSYSNSENKQWSITTSNGWYIKIEIYSVDIETNSVCQFDWLRFESFFGVTIRSVCGTTPVCFIYPGNSIQLKWRSDGTNTGTGWRLRYSQVSSQTTSCAASSCPYGWTHYSAKNLCLKEYTTRVTFAVALATCLANGGSLMQIRDSGDNAKVVSLLTSSSEAYYWLGFEDLQHTNSWKFVGGEEMTYFNWAPGNPVSGYQYCGAINSMYHDWHDMPCDGSSPYICMKQSTSGSPNTGNGGNGGSGSSTAADTGLSVGSIVGIVIGAVFILIAMAICCTCILMKSNKPKKSRVNPEKKPLPPPAFAPAATAIPTVAAKVDNNAKINGQNTAGTPMRVGSLALKKMKPDTAKLDQNDKSNGMYPPGGNTLPGNIPPTYTQYPPVPPLPPPRGPQYPPSLGPGGLPPGSGGMPPPGASGIPSGPFNQPSVPTGLPQGLPPPPVPQGLPPLPGVGPNVPPPAYYFAAGGDDVKAVGPDTAQLSGISPGYPLDINGVPQPFQYKNV